MEVVGFLSCTWWPLRSDERQELLLYEIGVRDTSRKQGTGRALLGEMEAWMRDSQSEVAWVLADIEGAVDFYRACGFEAESPQPTYMLRSVASAPVQAVSLALALLCGHLKNLATSRVDEADFLRVMEYPSWLSMTLKYRLAQ